MLEELYKWLWAVLGHDNGMEYGGINIANRLRAYYVFPAGAFLEFPDTHGYIEYQSSVVSRGSGIAPVEQNMWRIDGATFGVRFQAVPRSLGPIAPSRIDVKIPDQTEWPASTWNVLDARDSVHLTRDRVKRLGIAKLVAQANPDFMREYEELPFGSLIKIPSVALNVKEMKPSFVPNEALTSSMLSYEALCKLWGSELTREMPNAMNYRQLTYERQLAPSIVLVSLPAEYESRLMIFKSEVVAPSVLYHELKTLLLMQPMENVIEPPDFIVTTPFSATDATQMVCGFLLKYYELGDLERILPERRLKGKLMFQQQLQWAKQLTAAFIHLRSSSCKFYSDLRMDNVFLARANDGTEYALLGDFQQSRNIYNWAPPEIYYVEWIAEIGHEDFMRADGLPHHITEKFAKLLDDYLASRNYPLPLCGIPDLYDNPRHGWYFPWLSSTDEEQEAGMVYLLGKALWCLFEGVGDVDIVLGRSNPLETEQRFPTFRRTPPCLQKLICKCTEGAREWQDGHISIYRRGGKIYPLGKSGINGEPLASTKETKEAVKYFWRKELAAAENFLRARMRYANGEASKSDIDLLGYLRRPKLRKVQEILKKADADQFCEAAML